MAKKPESLPLNTVLRIVMSKNMTKEEYDKMLKDPRIKVWEVKAYQVGY